MVQTCQVNWTITIPKDTLATQLNKAAIATVVNTPTANAAVNFSGVADPTTEAPDMTQNQAVICSNSLSDLCTNNSVRVSPLESIIAGKRHCGVFIDILLKAIDAKAKSSLQQLIVIATSNYYLIPEDITFSGKLCIIIFIALDAGFLIRLESQKPDIVYLMHESVDSVINYDRFTVRIVNIPLQVNLTPLMHYLCEAVVRIMIYDAPDPQVLSLEVIGKLGGQVVKSG
ncbi:MAG: hypothetical protein EZS28_024930 [Streblomastix strix]|uniref:Uncharacterized protein n=1 Tax=Streblomastix strix TaxID=222440 RepID=A0A5J4VAL8_9EUKA|nr:MAG: hypothetical protein EZS28_024930 [Streblomastix strix]